MIEVSEPNGNKYAPVPGKIPGRQINMGGLLLTFAPLSLDQVQALEPVVAKMGPQEGKTLAATIEDALPILLASLQRNYPDLTIEQLRPLVDVGNFGEATSAVIDISGYGRTLPGETLPASP